MLLKRSRKDISRLFKSDTKNLYHKQLSINTTGRLMVKILKPYINNVKPFETKNTSISNNVFTTNEMYRLLDQFVENKTTLKNYRSRVNALNKLLNVQNEQFSDIFSNVKTLSSFSN